MKRKTARIALGSLTLVAVAGLWPFTRNGVPAVRLQVLDEHGAPASGVMVRESWRDYSAEWEGHEATVRTDAAGFVSFPKRSVRTFAFRVLAVSVDQLMAGVHASLGCKASIAAYGAEPHVWGSVDYRPGAPLPATLRLERSRPMPGP